MPSFSPRSLAHLASCHPDLARVCKELIKTFDFSVLCGHRSKAAQQAAVKNGVSRAAFPTSKHNQWPSLAIDVAPYPINWNDISRFHSLWRGFCEAAEDLRRKGKISSHFAWGGDWQNFKDYPHIEITEEK